MTTRFNLEAYRVTKFEVEGTFNSLEEAKKGVNELNPSMHIIDPMMMNGPVAFDTPDWRVVKETMDEATFSHTFEVVEEYNWTYEDYKKKNNIEG